MASREVQVGAEKAPVEQPQMSDVEEAGVIKLDTHGLKPLNENKRFVVMTAAVFAMICGSTSYAFNLFSGDLQKKYNYDSRAMSSINTVGMVFCYFLLPYGAVLDYFGPRPVYTLGCVLFPLGALLMGLTFQGVIEGSVVRFAVYNALLSLGSQLFDLGSVIVLLSIFPTRKGWVIALLKTMMGLGTSIIGAIQIGFFKDQPANYFYFLIGLVVVIGVAVQLVIKLPPYHLTGYEQKHLSDEQKAKRMSTMAVYLMQEPPMWRFYWGVGVIVVLVVYLPLTSALIAFCGWGQNGRMIVAIIAIVITAMLLGMMLPLSKLDRLTTKKSSFVPDADEEASVNSHGEPIHDREAETKVAPVKKEVATDIDYVAPAFQTTFLQSVLTVRLWCIFWTMFCGVGSEFVIIFNARFIYGALDGESPDSTVATLLTVLNGAGSALGRLAMSYFEVNTQRRKAEDRIPITASFFVPTSMIILAIVLFLVLPGRSLLVAYAIASLGNGFCASITILGLRTLYVKDPAKHYNFGYNALWIAAILLNRFLYGEWYAVQAEKQGSSLCFGKGCVLMPMLVMLGLNVSAFLSDIYLHVSYCRFSRKVLEERRRIKEEAAAAGAGTEDEGNSLYSPLKPPMEGSGVVQVAAVHDSSSNPEAQSLHDSVDLSHENNQHRA